MFLCWFNPSKKGWYTFPVFIPVFVIASCISVSFDDKNLANLESSDWASMKLDPLSENIWLGFLLLEANRQNDPIKASLIKYLTRCDIWTKVSAANWSLKVVRILENPSLDKKKSFTKTKQILAEDLESEYSPRWFAVLVLICCHQMLQITSFNLPHWKPIGIIPPFF